MARRVSVAYACDYDDKEIPEGGHRSIAFGLDGQEYEIDLCPKHGEKLTEMMGMFAAHARRVAARTARRRRRTAANRQRSAEIRAWAKNSGIEVSDRGRIPSHVLAGLENSKRG